MGLTILIGKDRIEKSKEFAKLYENSIIVGECNRFMALKHLNDSVPIYRNKMIITTTDVNLNDTEVNLLNNAIIK